MGHNAPMQVPIGAVGVLCLSLVLSAAAQAQRVQIRVTSVTTVIIPHDTPPKGKPNKGDTIDFKDLLINKQAQFGKQKGKPIAYDVGTVTYTTKTKTSMTVVVTFPGIGTLSYGGPMMAQKNGDTILPITGGTGGFKGAKGSVTIGAGSTTSPNTYQVTVPGHPLDLNGSGGVA
jgi:hypothetical protein